jgi:MerR family transcriptional regulator/heat shock protein HspR
MPARAKGKAKAGKARKRKKSRAGYMISAVAELYRVHPQTLRLYERLGLLKPSRTQGNTRVYTDQDLERLEMILTLSRDLGVNLAGIEVVLNMRDKMVEMERQVQSFVDFVREEMTRGLDSPQDARLRNAIVRFRPTKVVRVER